MTGITEIGALVAIVKALTDIAKAGPDLFGKRKKEAASAIATLKGRIGGLAAQLHETVVLLKTIPSWLADCDQILPLSPKAEDHFLQRAVNDLNQLIYDSRWDSFSDAFYKTEFDELPGIGGPMTAFRDFLERLEDQLKHVRPEGDLRAMRKEWESLMLRLRDLRAKAEDLRMVANALHAN